MKKNRRSGFSLIELVIVIAVIAVLLTVLVPMLVTFVEKANEAYDENTVYALNEVTALYKVKDASSDIFLDSTRTESELLAALVDGQYIKTAPSVKSSGNYLAFDFASQKWMLTDEDPDAVSYYTLTGSDVTLGVGGHQHYLITYLGTDTDILIPSTIDGVTVTNIYQDVFNGKGMTSVLFDSPSTILRIHARAFANNDLTEITLPDIIKRLDYGAFMGNDITQITIGSDVYMESNVFSHQTSFAAAYADGGAGTYVYENGAWVKQ